WRGARLSKSQAALSVIPLAIAGAMHFFPCASPTDRKERLPIWQMAIAHFQKNELRSSAQAAPRCWKIFVVSNLFATDGSKRFVPVSARIKAIQPNGQLSSLRFKAMLLHQFRSKKSFARPWQLCAHRSLLPRVAR